MARTALADDTNSPALSPQDYFEGNPSTYNDWITLTGGGLLTHGNQAQAEENLHWGTGAFGGIEDLHVQGSPFTNTLLTLDGHSIFDDHDYSLGLGLTHPDLGSSGSRRRTSAPGTMTPADFIRPPERNIQVRWAHWPWIAASIRLKAA